MQGLRFMVLISFRPQPRPKVGTIACSQVANEKTRLQTSAKVSSIPQMYIKQVHQAPCLGSIENIGPHPKTVNDKEILEHR